MQMHMNFGPEGGAATYDIFDLSGNALPIHYQYDTRIKGAETGYFIQGVEQCFANWKALAEYWPEFIKSKAEVPA